MPLRINNTLHCEKSKHSRGWARPSSIWGLLCQHNKTKYDLFKKGGRWKSHEDTERSCDSVVWHARGNEKLCVKGWHGAVPMSTL